MNLKKLFLMLTFFVLLGTTAFAQVYVSATDGDDTFGAGTQASKWRSITKALASAPTGSTIYIDAGIYDNSVIPTEASPVTLNTNRTFTLVAVQIGVNDVVEITDGFVLDHASAVVNMGLTGAKFNLGTTASALDLSAGALNIATANVILGSGATLTVTDGTLNTVPTTGANLNVTFDGTTTISSTSAFLPSSLGAGVLTVNKASGNITIDNGTLTANGVKVLGANAAAITFSGNVTSTAAIDIAAPVAVSFNGNVTVGSATAGSAADILNSSTGTTTIGSSAANTLTIYTTIDGGGNAGSDAHTGEVVNSSTGKIIVNATVSENIKNIGIATDAGDGYAIVATRALISNTGGAGAAVTLNGNVTFDNTNVQGTTAGANDVIHTIIISNSGAGAVTFNGSIETPARTGFTNETSVHVKLSNTGGGSFATRSAALRGVAGTEGISNKTAAGTMTLGQVGDTFTAAWDIVNDISGSILTLNGTGTLGGALTNGGTSASTAVLGADQTIAGLVTITSGAIKLNSNTLTLTRTGAAALANSGTIYSSTIGATGSGWVKFTGAIATMTGTGAMPNVEVNNTTSFASAAGNVYWGDFKTSGAGTVTIGGSSDIKGNLNVSGSGTVTINDAGNVSTTARGSVNMTSGSVTLGTAGLTVEGTFNISAGTFTFGSRTLTLKGNFNRTGGTIDATAAGTGTLLFNGATNQTFTPGTQMNVYKVTVNNTGNFLANVIDDNNITITASLIVLNDFTITAGRVLLSTSNIRMTQSGAAASARFTNGGRGYTATGVGGIIFEGSGANVATVAGDGAVLAGTQAYSNIYVRLTTATNNVFALNAVKISGVVTLDAGGIIWNTTDGVGGDDFTTTSALTLDDALVVPTVVINTQNGHASPYLVDGADGGAVALAITSVYNLTYTGQSAKTISGNEFITTKVNNLSITAGTAGKTITFTAADGAIVGALTVDNGDVLELSNGGARTLTASGNTAAHVVNGTVQGGTFAITGNAATLTGGSGTGNASSVAILTVTNASGTFTSTGMKVLGSVTINGAALVSNITMNTTTATLNTFTNTAGTTTLNMNSTAVAAGANYAVAAGSVLLTMNGAAAGTATIAGTLGVTGGTLTLGSNVWVTGAVTHSGAGVIALGDYNLTIANAYTHNNTATFTAGTGYLVSAAGAGVNHTFTTTVTIPNWEVKAAANTITFQTAGVTVSGTFKHTSGIIDFNSLPITLSGTDYIYTAGTYANTGSAATGVVNLTGSGLNVTMSGNPAVEYANVNSTGTVTFKSNNTTARAFTVSKTFTHTKGNIVLEINDIDLTDNGAANATYTTAATAGTVTGTATGADLGEVAFSGTVAGVQNLTLADNYSIQNLRVANTAHTSVTKTDTKVLTVGSNFALGDDFTFTATARLVLGDGATITRTNGVFDVVPTFGTTVNVVYNAGLNTSRELPTSTTVLNNLTINGAVVFAASATVNGTLFLTGGTVDLTTNTKVLTIVDGGTINRSGGAFGAGASDVPTVTNYNLVYSGAGAIADGAELISTKVTNLTVSMTGSGVTLANNRTVGAFTMSPTGAGAATVYFGIGADNALKTFTVTGTTTINNGIVSTKDAAGSDTDASTFSAQGSVVVNGGSFGFLGDDDADNNFDGGLNLSFGGAVAQSLTLNGNITIPNVTLNSTGTTAANAVVNVSGGNLTITNLLTFQNGILNMGSNTLYLPRPTGAANSGLAYDRSAVGVGEFGHVVGKISRQANSGDGGAGTNGRFEFPVGTLSGEYRPAAINFTPSYVVNNPVSIEVNHVNSTPEGTVGLPLDGGNNVKIGNYAPFYWLVNTTPSSLSSTQNFDIDMQANNIGVPYTSDEQLRIIRRQDGSANTNAWTMQGTAANYANYQVVTGSDTTVVARTTSSQGGLVVQGSRFAIGVPTRAPSFTAPTATAFTIAEGSTSTIDFDADPQDIGETITSYILVSGPSWAAINTTTGLVTLTPDFTVGSTTPYTLTVRATDNGGATAELTVSITVTDVNRDPSFTGTGTSTVATGSVKSGETFSFTYAATDADGDVINYSAAVTPTPTGTYSISTLLGTFTFSPVFADAGNTYTFTITATDGSATATTTTAVTVNYPVNLGDVDASGSVTSADASLILQYVVGLVTFDAQELWAANVNGDAQVGALDAAWVLFYAVEGTWPTSKIAAAAGTMEMGKAYAGDAGVIYLPVSLKNTSGALSLYTELTIDENAAEVVSVTKATPDGWFVAHNYSNSTLKIAMAGLNSLVDNNVVVIGLKLKDKESSLNITGNAQLNDELAFGLLAKVREIPADFAISQNYPNPFNPTTTIKYAIAQDVPVTVTVYNMLGQKVKTLVDIQQEAGYYTINWNGTNEFGGKVASGIYIYRLTAGKFTSTLKMNLLK